MTITAQKKIEFIDLAAQQDHIRQNIQNRMAKVLAHGNYIMGPEIAELENRLAAYVGTKHCVTCASGTDALLMALMALGIGRGDAVFTSPFTFIATAEVISLLGATPVFVDVDPRTFNIDPAKLEHTIRRVKAENKALQPKGIIPVDLFGQPADYDQIEQIGKQEGLFVLEDAAQSFGATYKGRKTGGLGDVGATSFFPAKPLGCYGDGGALFCNDDGVAETLRSLRVHGKGTDKYDNIRIGINGRLDTLQAAILLAKLDVFDEELQARDRVATRYAQGLSRAVTTPTVKPDRTSAWAQYSILTDARDELMKKLKTLGVPTAVYYPKPLHAQTAFADLGYRLGDFPFSEECSKKIMSIPMHPYMSSADQDYIVQSILSGLQA